MLSSFTRNVSLYDWDNYGNTILLRSLQIFLWFFFVCARKGLSNIKIQIITYVPYIILVCKILTVITFTLNGLQQFLKKAVWDQAVSVAAVRYTAKRYSFLTWASWWEKSFPVRAWGSQSNPEANQGTVPLPLPSFGWWPCWGIHSSPFCLRVVSLPLHCFLALAESPPCHYFQSEIKLIKNRWLLIVFMAILNVSCPYIFFPQRYAFKFGCR